MPPRRGLERKAGSLMKNEMDDALQKNEYDCEMIMVLLFLSDVWFYVFGVFWEVGEFGWLSTFLVHHGI